MEKIQPGKGELLYDMTNSGYYRGTAEKRAPILMNVTFRLPSEELEAKFVADSDRERTVWAGPPRGTGPIRPQADKLKKSSRNR